MKKKLIILLALSIFLLNQTETYASSLIPLPNKVENSSGSFQFNNKTHWIIENKEQLQIVQQLTNCFAIVTSWNLEINIGSNTKTNCVILKTNSKLSKEEYKLQITTQKICIEAATSNGFFYAIQTLRQLLPPQINASRMIKGVDLSVPCVTITDAPRFGYRGFMLDVSRYFTPKSEILKLIDYLAYHKINTFHWHLVDDNGWRIEIKKYPKLTDVSAWRVERNSYFPMRTNPEPGEPTTQGGYYSQNDIKEIVKYAQERFIEVIPEIEMPAHTNSSLAAYPNLACPVNNHFIGVLPGGVGKSEATIYCAGNDSVFNFLEDVLTEVIDLFPSKYIHIGGDEANKENWKICPKCQARMQANNIPNEEELQSYFIRRINHFLKSKGKRLMGWDELVDSEIPENAVIFGWRGMGLGAEKAGAKQFSYIKSPALKYYFIRYQGPQWFEPYTYFGNTTLKDVYTYEPVSNTVPDSVSKNMLGIESCLWTEFARTTREVEYLISPRLAAFAESAWTKPENKSWNNFVERVDKVLVSYDFMGINSAKSLYNLAHKVRPVNGKLEVEISSIYPLASIHYTLDGSEPKYTSSVYKNKLMVAPGTIIRAATFNKTNRLGQILPLNIIQDKAVGCKIISKDSNAYVLTNGLRGSEKMTDGEWIEFYDRNGQFTIDLGSSTMCSSVQLGMLNNVGMVTHFPASVKIEASNDGITYQTIVQKNYSEVERFQNGMFISNELYTFPAARFRFMRFDVQNPGVCPPLHIHAGQKSRMAFDEVIVK